MKKFQKQFNLINLFLFVAAILMLCAWQGPSKTNGYGFSETNKKDTFPKTNNKGFDQQSFDKAMKEIDVQMANLNEEMKNININIDKNLQKSLSEIDYEKIAKDAEASVKTIDWENMQKEVNASMKQAQAEIAKIDFKKLQAEMKDLQTKMQSEEFKQVNLEKIQEQAKDAMKEAKVEMEKAKVKMQQMKDFTDALAADGFLDKKKAYTIEWKSGNLYINGKEQSKDISDKYRKYEDTGTIRMQADNAEDF